MIKKEIVEKDEKDKNHRTLLNFGHTIAHALEALSDYQLSHGDAVAMGLVFESYLSFLMGILDEDSFERIKNLFRMFDFHWREDLLKQKEKLKTLLQHDKKNKKARVYCVLLRDIGEAYVKGELCSFPIEEDLWEVVLTLTK